MSGPKCSALSPTEIEALRQRARQQAQQTLADFIASELDVRALAERLIELGEQPPRGECHLHHRGDDWGGWVDVFSTEHPLVTEPSPASGV